MDDYIILKYVDLLNCWNSIYTNSLQGTLKPFVVCGGDLVNSLLLSAFKEKILICET